MAAQIASSPAEMFSHVSAAGILSMLEEEDVELRRYSLQRLHEMVDFFWSEISDQLEDLEALSEDEAFPDRDLAAAVASKCYYHLEEYNDALRLALVAGKYFDIDEESEYVQTIVSRCIDEYISARRAADATADTGDAAGDNIEPMHEDDEDDFDAEAQAVAAAATAEDAAAAAAAAPAPDVDPAMLAIVERMFEKCYATGHFRQAMGVAFEAQDLPKIETTLSSSGDSEAMLGFCFKLCQTADITRGFRTAVLRILSRKYRTLAEPDYINVCQCLQYLNDARGVAAILCDMARGGDLKLVKALQVAFVLVENQNQQFMMDVCAALELPKSAEAVAAEAAAAAELAEGNNDADAPAAGDVGGAAAAPADGEGVAAAERADRKRKTEGEGGGGAAGGDTDAEAPDNKRASFGSSPRGEPDGPEPAAPPMTEEYVRKVEQLRKVLDGSETTEAHLAFLCRNNMTDLLLLDQIREATAKARNFSVLHNAAVVAHAYMNAGTTSDAFLRNNLQWLANATNWARFTAIAALGVVHKGHVKNSMSILDTYLPKDGGAPAGGDPGQTFTEGGALFALGLIHANKYDQEKITYLQEALQRSTHPTHVHGACLGLGFAGMSAGTVAHMDLLQETLYQHEDAVAGEGAALTMGLLNMGHGNTTEAARKAIEVMLPHAHATNHEKIIRGHAVGLALIMYQQEEAALTLIHTLCRDKDPILRYGGVFTIGLAYCGTANNKQIARLLHIAVSDVSNDVKRAAVTMLGYVMLKNPAKVPQLVSLLSHSYSPHIRYGAAMAVGVACSGTSLPSALEILNPLLTDSVDFVRSAAHMCKAMVIMQDAPKYQPFADSLAEIVSAKAPNSTTLPRAGAVVASGILNAGGRNVTISLVSDAGLRMQAAIAGMTIWLQHWYWYPYYAALSLTFTPTVLIGFNKDLKIPTDFALQCNARPSLFAYPEPIKEAVEEKKERVETVTLSITAAAEARRRKKAGGKGQATEGGAGSGGGGSKADAKPDDTPDADADKAKGDAKPDDAKSDDAKDKKKKEKEPRSFRVENPGRVTQRQRQHMALVDDAAQRYRPIMANVRSGAVMLVDATPDAEESFVDFSKPLNPKTKVPGEEDEPAPPAPFVWRPEAK